MLTALPSRKLDLVVPSGKLFKIDSKLSAPAGTESGFSALSSVTGACLPSALRKRCWVIKVRNWSERARSWLISHGNPTRARAYAEVTRTLFWRPFSRVLTNMSVAPCACATKRSAWHTTFFFKLPGRRYTGGGHDTHLSRAALATRARARAHLSLFLNRSYLFARMRSGTGNGSTMRLRGARERE